LRSLFLVSLPRSLSSLVYQVLLPALGLAEPVWTSDGEVLNLHRFVHLPVGSPEEGVRFTTSAGRPARFARLTAFLDQVVHREGFLYKDVVQPFAVASWLPASGVNVLRLERPLADVAWSMLQRGWLYPSEASDHRRGPEWRCIQGLARAAAAMASLPGPVLHYDALVREENLLTEAVRQLYPELDLSPIALLNDTFRSEREAILARRATERYRWIAEVCEEVSQGEG
jgi:hypothetical protein